MASEVPTTRLLEDVRAILRQARGQVYAAANAAMVEAYWQIGRRIVEEEQGGATRAEYGTQLIRNLSRDLAGEFGKGLSIANLKNFRQFYLTFPDAGKSYALRSKLSWTPCWVINNAFIEKPHRGGSLEFLWRTLCTIDFSQFIGGSANPYMPLKNFGHTPVVMPPTDLLNAYQERAGSLAAKIVANDHQPRTLATLRDTLLPKLLSGEVSTVSISVTNI